MQVLVTGANSFIGRHVAAALARAGHDVTATFRSQGENLDRLRQLAPTANAVPLDFESDSDFAALPASVDAVVHIAGVSAAPGVDQDDLVTCNILGTGKVLKYARRVGARRLIYTSTMSVYGAIEEPVVTEQTPIRDPDTYGASKYFAERMIAGNSDWLPCVALRLPSVLGAGAHRAWIPTVFNLVKQHKSVKAYHLQAAFNNAVHVDDLAKLVIALLDWDWSGFHAFPIGAAGQISIAELLDLLISLTGSRSKVVEGSAVKTPFTISSDYAVKHFGYEPANIKEILRRYVKEST